MNLLKKSDEEICTIAKPFWKNLVRASNMKDYGGFTRDFSTQMLFGANEVELYFVSPKQHLGREISGKAAIIFHI